MSDLECPYCGHEQEVCHDDGFGYSEDVLHEVECHECEKTFGFRTSISFHYEPVATPCLNGESHDWKEGHRYGVNEKEPFYRCAACEKETKEAAIGAKGEM